jgi:glucose/arabinose dehydrogenase
MHRIFLVLVILSALLCVPASAAAAPLELPDRFSSVPLAEGLNGPTAITYAPDGRLFIAEKSGRLRVVSADGALRATPVLDISDHVANEGDQGLLGLALDTSFATNGLVYLLYTFDADPANPLASKTARLTRIRVLPDNSVENAATPETVLLGSVGPGPCPPPANTVDCIPSDSGSHSIGTVRSDADGTLWVGSGDGSDYNSVTAATLRTYDESSLSGKMLHVDREGRGLPGHAFCPAETDLGLVCTKLHAKGFRNPFRFYLRPGGSPVAGDVGAGSREELDFVDKGSNYGWPCWEGSIKTPGYRDLSECEAQYELPQTVPAYEYARDGGAAVQAGPRYVAGLYPPGYRGWFFADFVQGFIKLYDVDDQGRIVNVRPFATGYQGVDLELAPNGDLVYADVFAGSVFRISYTAPREGEPNAPAPAAPGSPPGGGVPRERAVPGPSLRLRRPSQSGRRSLGGRLLRSEDRLRVEVALRTRGTRCRSWSPASGGFGKAQSRCDRPRWMRASLTRLGFGDWLWRANLRGPLRRGSYVVSTRAVDAKRRVVVGVRSTVVRVR